MIILFNFFLLTLQYRDVEFDSNYFWTQIDQIQDMNIYRIKNLKQLYYYVQVTLFQEDLSFQLMYDLNQVAQLNSTQGDYVRYFFQQFLCYYEQRRTRFLKIGPGGKIIYITAFSNKSKGQYNITIWGSSDDYCDNNCSLNGICTDDGCECNSGYIGTDCHQSAMEIQKGETQINLYGDEIQFIYFNLIDFEELNIKLKLRTDSKQGIEIIFQLSNAIIVPSQNQFFNESKLIKKYTIDASQSFDMEHSRSVSYYHDLYIIIGVRQINGHLNTLVSSLIINLTNYYQTEDTVSIIVIIIIVISISAAVIIIIILFFVCKNIQRKKILMQQARQRINRLRDLSSNQEEQMRLFNSLIPVIINEQNTLDNCSICLGNLNDNQEVRQTNCHHNFHSLCIKEWISNNKKDCPVCRTNLDNQIIQSYPNSNK